jgi:hypothetical protein
MNQSKNQSNYPPKIKTEDGFVWELQPDGKTYIAGDDLAISAEEAIAANQDPDSIFPSWVGLDENENPLPVLDQLPVNRPQQDKHDPNKVRPTKCATCPFRNDAQALGNENGRDYNAKLRTQIIASALSEGNRYCHHEALHGEIETWLCRGARDVQLQYFHAIGLLAEPTDEYWRELTEKLGLA